MTAVILDNVTISYDRHPAVHHVSGRFESGSLTAIAGPNGAGKSTLLKAIAGILTPSQGGISQEGGGRLAYMPQSSDIQRDFPITALEMVASGHWHRTGGLKAMGKDTKLKAMEALASVGLQGLGGRLVGTLSTGQFQRLQFARLMMQEAQLILLDEPFAAVDAETTASLMSLIQQWHKEGRTIICVLHDLDQIRTFFPQCLLLSRECVGWDTPAKLLKPEHLLTTKLFNGWSMQAERCERA